MNKAKEIAWIDQRTTKRDEKLVLEIYRGIKKYKFYLLSFLLGILLTILVIK